MRIIRLLCEAPRLIRWMRKQYLALTDPVAYARALGVKIGEGTRIEAGDTGIWGSEPYLVTVGSGCRIGSGVRFITHEGGVFLFRSQYPEIDVMAPVVVGNNTTLEMRAIILPGVKVGHNCIVRCASVVTRDVPDNTVVAGVPARVTGRTGGSTVPGGSSIRTRSAFSAGKEAELSRILPVEEAAGKVIGK